MHLPSFGDIALFAEIAQCKDPVIVVFDELVDRKIKRNRYEILGPSGRQLLTVPIGKPRDRKLLSVVEIVNAESWQRDHWRSIVTAYNRAPFFEFYDYKYMPLFSKKYNSLVEFNLEAMKITTQLLKLNKKIDFLDGSNGEQTNLKPTSFPKYNQVFSEKYDFEENVSILDLVFNLGPDAKDYLEAVTFSSE